MPWALFTLSIRLFLGIRREKRKSKGRETFFSLPPPPPPDSKTSSPLTPKEGLFLRLDALCWISLIVAYSPRNGSLDRQSLQNVRLWCCPNTVLCVHYRKLYSTVAHRNKTLPRIQVFRILGSMLESLTCFWFLRRVLNSWKCFLILGLVLSLRATVAFPKGAAVLNFVIPFNSTLTYY